MDSELWQGQSVLVVEDSATTRATIGLFLKGVPVEVEFETTVERLLARAEQTAFGLILLDDKLPDGSGLEAMAEVRGRIPTTPVVLITGEADMGTATRAVAADVDGYIDKRHFRQGPEAFQRALEAALLHRQRQVAERQLQALTNEVYSVVAHDLRTPAATASMALAMYREHPRDEVLQAATDALDTLFRRLDRYLDLNRLEAGFAPMHLEPVQLPDLVEELVGKLRPLASMRGRELVWSPPQVDGPECLVDWDWMSQALENLLDNALKYSFEGGRVEVRCTQEQDAYAVSVSDSGPGIATELQPFLFERYFRAPTVRGRVQGHGLGLLLVHRVVRAHQGQVSVTSTGKPGQGSTFTVRLPMHRRR